MNWGKESQKDTLYIIIWKVWLVLTGAPDTDYGKKIDL